MNKKLMLLATGVLAALAFAALPAAASAGEFKADCETTVNCQGTVSGGLSILRNDKGEGIQCSSVGGQATLVNESATGNLELTFKTCKENITGFGFSCNNTGVAGEIKTGLMVTHLIYLEPNATTPALKVTLPGHGTASGGVTFNCAGFAKKTVTGSVIGHITNPGCGVFQASHTAVFAEKPGQTGIQAWMHATTSGSTTDLISSNDAGGEYTTSAQIGEGKITWGEHRAKLTC